MKRSRTVVLGIRFLAPAVLILSALLCWEIVVREFDIKSYILPAPSKIFSATVSNIGLLIDHAKVTLAEILLGLGLGVSGGVALAVLMSVSGFARLALQPILVSSQTFPKEALAPLFIVWFGFGLSSKVVITALICFFPVCISMLKGLDSVEAISLDVFRVYHASPRLILYKLRLPASLPYFFSGLRVSATLSVIGAVVGEFVGASKGLGHLIRVANFQLSTELIFSALLMLGLIGSMLYLTVIMLERAMMRWFPHLKTLSGN